MQGYPLVWQNWDRDEYVVYHTGSGDTHLVNEIAAAILRELEGDALDARELAGRVADALDCDTDADFPPYVEQLLLRLDELGLVEPSS